MAGGQRPSFAQDTMVGFSCEVEVILDIRCSTLFDMDEVSTSLAISAYGSTYTTCVGSRIDLDGFQGYGYAIDGVLGVAYGDIGVLTIEGILRYYA